MNHFDFIAFDFFNKLFRVFILLTSLDIRKMQFTTPQKVK